MACDASSGGRCPSRSRTGGWHTGDMADETSKDAPADDSKERYRQALERKKSQGGHAGHGQSSATGASKGSSAKAGGKREFRRKSG
jgi:hypothetical protein